MSYYFSLLPHLHEWKMIKVIKEIRLFVRYIILRFIIYSSYYFNYNWMLRKEPPCLHCSLTITVQRLAFAIIILPLLYRKPLALVNLDIAKSRINHQPPWLECIVELFRNDNKFEGFQNSAHFYSFFLLYSQLNKRMHLKSTFTEILVQRLIDLLHVPK